jgi:hypothetical protein
MEAARVDSCFVSTNVRAYVPYLAIEVKKSRAADSVAIQSRL